MQCEQANPLLVEHAAGELSSRLHQQMEEHLQDCKTCQADYAAIGEWSSLAKGWHDETQPAWKPPAMPGRDYFELFRQWFPSFASAAALAMVALVYIQQPQSNGILPATGKFINATDYQNLPVLPQATQAAMVEQVMANSREQRQEELQALLKILKSEMDKRSIETEESLRFIISHQIQGQQELDDLYAQVEHMMASEASSVRPSEAQQSSLNPPNQGVIQ